MSLLAVATLSLALTAPHPLQAQSECGTDEYVIVCIGETDPPPKPTVTNVEQPGGSNTSVGIPASPIVWSRSFIPAIPVGDAPCRAVNETTNQIIITYGAEWLVMVTNTDTGELLTIYTYCEWPGDDPPQPPPLPEPPGETDVATRAILTLETGVNPPIDGVGGVTQLDTWFWCDDPGVVDVEARTSGSAARAEVSITELVWTITGPSGTHERRTTTCGSEPDPDSDGDGAAATWTPSQTGDHLITLSATWNGSWVAELVLDRYGVITAGPFPLAPLTITGEPLTYPVVEIQTVGGRP